MDHGDKPTLKQQEKQKMLDELESLSRMLDEDLDDDDESFKPSRPIPEDIPVLKSFVDDVPVLNERFIEEFTPAPPPPAPPRKTDSVDRDAGQFHTLPNTRHNGPLDVSFLDKDPLEISAAVRQSRQVPDQAIPALDTRVETAVKPEAEPAKPAAPVAPVAAATTDRIPPSIPAPPPPMAETPRPEPAAARPAMSASAVLDQYKTPAPATSGTAPVTGTSAGKAATPSFTPRPSSPISPAVSASFMPGASSNPVLSATPPAPPHNKPTAAASAAQPLSRFQTGTKTENPFLPKSTLDKIRDNHANDAASELRKLIESNPLQKLTFDMAPNSREYQQLRSKASQMVNEVIRANMPRLEAELRLKLEQEVDRMFKELKKK